PLIYALQPCRPLWTAWRSRITTTLRLCSGLPLHGEHLLRRRRRPWYRLLRLVGVSWAGGDFQTMQNVRTKPIVWHPSSHCALDDSLGMLQKRLAQRLLSQTAGIAGVAIIDLLVQAIACHRDLLCVDDNNVVTTVQVRREGRLVLAAQDSGGGGRHLAE